MPLLSAQRVTSRNSSNGALYSLSILVLTDWMSVAVALSNQIGTGSLKEELIEVHKGLSLEVRKGASFCRHKR